MYIAAERRDSTFELEASPQTLTLYPMSGSREMLNVQVRPHYLAGAGVGLCQRLRSAPSGAFAITISPGCFSSG